MDVRLCEVMEGQEENYLLPFLWMHDGYRNELPELVESVWQSGARAFCVESRPHEHFCEQEWWDDMDVLLSEAEKRGMKVWILDDKHFPTGYANGLAVRKYPHLRKWHLLEDHVDVVGPAPEHAILLNRMGQEDEILLGVYACRRTEEAETWSSETVDLTSRVQDGYVFWDIPEGVWRVMALWKSRRGAYYPEYIHMIDPESVKVLIEAVYEPHYAHYARYFGNVIAGFFSDEPSLGNKQTYRNCNMAGMYDQMLGQPGLALPWTDEVMALLQNQFGEAACGLLPSLWFPGTEQTEKIRVAYMDAITKLWKRHFSEQIGSWCREHGVEYIGHIIEDMNAHARMGQSAGHYFRALDGQDMAGIDVVLHQVMPGMAHFDHASILSGNFASSRFFDYALARLAASHSHIQKRMKGRAMCEVFGAYGWAEGVPMMKHLIDHMLVRGINRFVPHAFSPLFPDPDCPPHFNAGGHNPQFRAFAELMRYTNRSVHLMEDAVEIVSAAILYHAEAEWSGRRTMMIQDPARLLYDSQLNYDFLPLDILFEDARVQNGRLCVNNMIYPILIVPGCEWLPSGALDCLHSLKRQGMKVVYAGYAPENDPDAEVILPEALEKAVRAAGGEDVRLSDRFDLLRFRHVVRDHTHVFLFVNESMSEAFEGTVVLPVKGKGVRADLQSGSYSLIHAENGRMPLKLERGQSVMLIFGTDIPEDLREMAMPGEKKEPEWNWRRALQAYHAKEEGPFVALQKLYNVTGPLGDPGFSGWMRYETEFTAEGNEKILSLGQVGDCAEVWLNGQDLGIRFDAPYEFDIGKAVQKGINHLCIEISNTLVHAIPDRFSSYVQITPSGLLGPVRLLN